MLHLALKLLELELSAALDPSPKPSFMCLCAAPLPAYFSDAGIGLRSIRHRRAKITRRLWSWAITAVLTCVFSVVILGAAVGIGREGILTFYVVQCTAWIFLYLENEFWKWNLSSVGSNMRADRLTAINEGQDASSKSPDPKAAVHR